MNNNQQNYFYQPGSSWIHVVFFVYYQLYTSTYAIFLWHTFTPHSYCAFYFYKMMKYFSHRSKWEVGPKGRMRKIWRVMFMLITELDVEQYKHWIQVKYQCTANNTNIYIHTNVTHFGILRLQSSEKEEFYKNLLIWFGQGNNIS